MVKSAAHFIVLFALLAAATLAETITSKVFFDIDVRIV